MSDLFDERLKALQTSVPQFAADVAYAAGIQLVDVRGPDEVQPGVAAGAFHVGRDHLERRIVGRFPDSATPLCLYCASGTRSLFAAAQLRDLGYSAVSSMRGGFDAWKAAGLPVERPDALPADARVRYARHLAMDAVGDGGQRRLLDARVLVVGAGGLGSPAALYLAAAGVGHLTLADDDTVERSNLQRQVLHTDGDVGRDKVASAVDGLLSLNPSINVDGVTTRVQATNAGSLLAGHDVVLDGTDDHAARAALNAACVAANIPYVYGAVHGFEGQVAVFHPPEGGCLACLFPEAPSPDVAPTCAEAGVLGALPGVIGTMQALEVLKILLGLDGVLRGRLLQYDALGPRTVTLDVPQRPGCQVCG